MSLPTPVAVVASFIGSHHADLEAAYERALLRELDRILDVVPAARLALQWDTAVEFAVFEGVFPSWFGDDYPTQHAEVMQRLLRLGRAVPDEVPLGYHLCYGDFEHSHFVEPADAPRRCWLRRAVAYARASHADDALLRSRPCHGRP